MIVLGEERPCTECGIKLCIACSDAGIHRERRNVSPFGMFGPCRVSDPFEAIRTAFDDSPIQSAIDHAEEWTDGVARIVTAQKSMLDAFKRHHDCTKTGHVFEVEAVPCGGRCVSCGADIEKLEPSEFAAYVSKCEATAEGASEYERKYRDEL